MDITPNNNNKRTITPTNSLILLIPSNYYKIPNLINLLKNHFTKSYGGNLLNWTNLIGLSRILIVYDQIESARDAKVEMDFFVWEEDDVDDANDDVGERGDSMDVGSSSSNGVHVPIKISTSSEPLRVFYGPLLSLPLPSLEQTLLSVPALSKNFLISPPGSPPVGWEQTLEEAPNSFAFDFDDVVTTTDGMRRGSLEGGRGGEKKEEWGEELARALRFLSVSSNDEEDEDLSTTIQSSGEEGSTSSSTTTIIPPITSLSPNGSNLSNSLLRPSITLSTPPISSHSSSTSINSQQHSQDDQTNLNNSRALAGTKITNVKATIESMLGRKKSLIFNLGEEENNSTSSISNGNGSVGLERLGNNGNRVIIPTARPPTNDESPYLEN